MLKSHNPPPSQTILRCLLSDHAGADGAETLLLCSGCLCSQWTSCSQQPTQATKKHQSSFHLNQTVTASSNVCWNGSRLPADQEGWGPVRSGDLQLRNRQSRANKYDEDAVSLHKENLLFSSSCSAATRAEAQCSFCPRVPAGRVLNHPITE